jgi:hypothetical protein
LNITTRWKLAHFAVFFALLGGIVLALILSAGAADPPYAGPIWFSDGTPISLDVPASQTIPAGNPIVLPTGSYTLEISAAYSADSDPMAGWAISFVKADQVVLEIWLYNDAYFSMPPVFPDSASFFHIRPAGKVNQLYLDRRANGDAVLRFNREIAWHGKIIEADQIRLRARGGPLSASHLIIEQRVIYFPHNPT